MQNMYRQQSLITLDQFYEMKPLTKLESILSFIDYSLHPMKYAVPKSKIPMDDPTFPNWGGKFDTNGNFIKWFGWKMHAMVDTYSSLPISYIITPANIADVDVAEKLIQKMMDDYKNGLTPKYYMMDAGYDKPELYSSVYHKYHGQAIIPINISDEEMIEFTTDKLSKGEKYLLEDFMNDVEKLL